MPVYRINIYSDQVVRPGFRAKRLGLGLILVHGSCSLFLVRFGPVHGQGRWLSGDNLPEWLWKKAPSV